MQKQKETYYCHVTESDLDGGGKVTYKDGRIVDGYKRKLAVSDQYFWYKGYLFFITERPETPGKFSVTEALSGMLCNKKKDDKSKSKTSDNRDVAISDAKKNVDEYLSTGKDLEVLILDALAYLMLPPKSIKLALIKKGIK